MASNQSKLSPAMAIKSLQRRRDYLVEASVQDPRFNHWVLGKEQAALEMAIRLLQQMLDRRHMLIVSSENQMSNEQLESEFFGNASEQEK